MSGAGKRVVLWQVPLGNTKMQAQDDSWGHYQDNRVEWFLDDPGGTHLALWRDAGVIAILYGGGAGGTTCACDAQNDGVTNPPRHQRQHRGSVSADDDGGYFHQRAAAYYGAGALVLDPGSGGGGGGGGGGGPVARWTLSAAPSPTGVHRRHNVTITSRIKASIAVRAVVRVDVYDPRGRLAFRRTYAARTYRAGATVTLRPAFYVGSTRRLGTYTIKIRILGSPGGALLSTKTSTRTFRVLR